MFNIFDTFQRVLCLVGIHHFHLTLEGSRECVCECCGALNPGLFETRGYDSYAGRSPTDTYHQDAEDLQEEQEEA